MKGQLMLRAHLRFGQEEGLVGLVAKKGRMVELEEDKTGETDNKQEGFRVSSNQD